MQGQQAQYNADRNRNCAEGQTESCQQSVAPNGPSSRRNDQPFAGRIQSFTRRFEQTGRACRTHADN